MKTISKGLILALVIQFALVLPLINIARVEKAKAEGPVMPTDSTIRFSSNSSAQQVITIKVNENNPPADWTATFQAESQGTSSFYDNLFNDGQLPRLNSSRPANNSDIIRKYKITSPNIGCLLENYKVSGNVEIDYNSDLYLITVKYIGEGSQGSGDFFLGSGIYRESQINKKLVRLTNGDMNSGADYCGNLSGEQKQIINLTNSTYMNAPVRLDIPEGERVSRCNNMEMRWNNVVDNMRKLMIPAPSANPKPEGGRTGNQYWVAKDAVNIRWADFASWAARIFPYYTNDHKFDDTYDYTLDLGLTDEGEKLYDEIADQVGQIKNDIDVLRQAYPGDIWPPGCVNIKEFRWSETAPTRNYQSLNEFYDHFDKIYQFFKDAIASRDEAISTGGDDICGNTGINLVSGKIFQWLFCELANIIHGIAAKIMTEATKWLTESIGVDINIKFKDPAKDDKASTGGSGSNTPTPENPTSGERDTPKTIDQKAIDLCNQKKPPATSQEQWNRGPCLSNNYDNTGYAIDIAHSPRLEIDNQNTCDHPVKWIELNTNCSIINRQD